jgi:GAF domain-containing protein
MDNHVPVSRSAITKQATPIQSGKNQTSPENQAGRYALMGFIFGMIFPVIGMIIRLAQLQLPLNISDMILVQQTDSLLWIIETAPLFLGLFAWLAGREQDTLIETNKKLLEQEEELKHIQENLEQRVGERTVELARKTNQLRASSLIAQQMAELQDVPALLSRTVQLISEQFEFYHVGVFLLDDQHRIAFLQAASSEGGKRLIESGHHVAVGDESIIGRVTERTRYYIVKDTEGPAALAKNPELPYTRSQLALPLMVRGTVIGVMDIQSNRPESFDPGEAEILQSLADVLATTIDNVRLLNETQAFVSQLETLTSQQTRVTWQEQLKAQKLAYHFTPSAIKPISSGTRPKDHDELSVPLVLRGQEIGSIGLKRKEDSRWTPAEHDLIEKVAIQVALALDNSRLLEETRQRAIQEQTVNEISARLGRSLDIDTLLQTAVRELAALPEVAEVSVFIGQATEEKQTTE